MHCHCNPNGIRPSRSAFPFAHASTRYPVLDTRDSVSFDVRQTHSAETASALRMSCTQFGWRPPGHTDLVGNTVHFFPHWRQRAPIEPGARCQALHSFEQQRMPRTACAGWTVAAVATVAAAAKPSAIKQRLASRILRLLHVDVGPTEAPADVFLYGMQFLGFESPPIQRPSQNASRETRLPHQPFG
jgi:hypothetical protein